MRGIGVILIIIFAIASALNKRAMRRAGQTAGKSGPGKGQKFETPLKKAMRQFQEAVEQAARVETEKKPVPVKKAPPAPDKAAEEAMAAEPVFRGSIETGEQTPPERPAAVSRPGEAAPPPAAARQMGGILPQLSAGSLVQAVVTHEILTRPRSAWQPRRETRARAVPRA